MTVQWLQNVADVRVLRDFQESPLQRHAVEQPHLLTLPTCDFDTARRLCIAMSTSRATSRIPPQLVFPVPWSPYRPGAAVPHL